MDGNEFLLTALMFGGGAGAIGLGTWRGPHIRKGPGFRFAMTRLSPSEAVLEAEIGSDTPGLVLGGSLALLLGLFVLWAWRT